VPNNVQARYRIRVGDADQALAQAEHKLAMTVRSQRVMAAPMEARGVLAERVEPDPRRHAEVIGELGVDTLSQEQRKALPAVLEEHVWAREEHREDDRKEQRRQVWIHLATSFLSALVTAIVVVTGFVAWLSTHGSGVGR